MLSRRSILKGLTLGAGSLALSPFLNHLEMLHGADAPQFPKRFVFVVKGSGLQADFINPAGLQHGGDQLVDEALGDRKLAEGMESLEPFRDKLTIVQGLSGKMCTTGHSAFYGALGAYRAQAHEQPSAATIDGYLAKQFPSVFGHIGLKMGDGSQGIAYPSISAAGENQQLPFQCNPELAYQNLFGSIASGGDVRKKYQRTGNVLDAMAGDIRKLQRTLGSNERDKLGYYLNGFESLRDRRLKLASMQKVLEAHAPQMNDKYVSSVTTHHLEAHFDMAAAALITGISNVVTLHCDDLGSSYSGIGITPIVHSVGHGADSGMLSSQDCRNLIRKFHFDLIGDFAKKLDEVPEGTGTMLDNTVIVYLSDNSDKHHSTAVEWPMVVLGNLGGALKTQGRYLSYPRYGAAQHHHTLGNMLTTLTHAAGAPVDHFGQPDFALGKPETQSGPLSELLA
ncbi:DUF1552 domain-containing protein [Blastopirellula marina]|uniref:DUF1552 domain-containing protein n=1 Tax=Blastopirellula marina TaxID=124 RepID=A0A2S8FA87_9BACT|nr:DUF1552 domain-containing protein [Blastopirellula marina]PQO29083.1 hypothetical protein C5Y98_23035 [Blastopirellula marina]PTL42355.1 DUF1552 domain-containing protein [Blastopirellula marina]